MTPITFPTMFRRAPIVIALLAAAFAVQPADAQAPATAPAASGEQATDKDESKSPKSSLDELLGIDEGAKDPSAAEAAARDREEELKRRLNEAEVADAFETAITKMALSAELLDAKFESGLGTQRVQEEIIAKLDQLIDAAKRMGAQASSSSASSSSSSSSQQNNPSSGKDPGKQQQQQQANGEQKRNNNPTDSQEGESPPMQEGDINTVIDESRTEWGNLPQRVRDMLLQGRREKFSSLYEQLTAEYYKRLAEEGTP